VDQAASKPCPLWKRAIPLVATAILFTVLAGLAVWELEPRSRVRFFSTPPTRQLMVRPLINQRRGRTLLACRLDTRVEALQWRT
jgi:hypothetical protein